MQCFTVFHQCYHDGFSMLQEHYLLLLGHECEVIILSKSTSRRRSNTLATHHHAQGWKLHPKRGKLPGPLVILSKICISFDDERVQSQWVRFLGSMLGIRGSQLI